MKIKFMGAAGTVTGSSYVLTSGAGKSILIDLGMFQGIPPIDHLNYDPYAYDCSQLVGCVLTHAHLDHCGRLPILLSHGFTGEIWMTPPTKELTQISLLDSAKVAKQDEKPFLYDKELALQTFDRFKTINLHTSFNLGDFCITFFDAGHILGSTSLEIVDTQANSEINRIVFSGDLGNTPEPLEPETESFDVADAVVIESTYGGERHPLGDPLDALLAEVGAVETSGGTLLIPSFSLERTQELLHMIMHAKQDGKVKQGTKIYLDSPMAEKATTVYLKYPAYLNAHLRSDISSGDPFSFSGLKQIQSPEQSKAIFENQEPKVIIAGSGMMTGGRILGHSAHYLPDPTTRLFLVGFQGEGTLGRELAQGAKAVSIEGVPISVKAQVNVTRTMSSHADQAQLLSWLGVVKNVKKVFITHGEDHSRQALSDKIVSDLHLKDIVLPMLHQEVNL